MALNKAMRIALKTISSKNMNFHTFRRWTKLKTIDPLKPFYKTIDYKVYNKEHEVPLRIYLPNKAELSKDFKNDEGLPVLLFIHGGGWVAESIETYNRVCFNLAKNTKNIVVSIDYRLAPEYHFPIGLEDCYEAVKSIYLNKFILNVDSKNITLIGDSAGGNLVAALSLMAKDRKEFFPEKQILIYPCLNNDYTESSPYYSVIENGEGYILTAKKIQAYIELYQRDKKDLYNPYFAPLTSQSLENQPKTLIITAEYDPLRDEGEDYGKKLKQCGNKVKIYRLKNALHGYFAFNLTSRYTHIQRSYQIINRFLNEG